MVLYNLFLHIHLNTKKKESVHIIFFIVLLFSKVIFANKRIFYFVVYGVAYVVLKQTKISSL